MEDVPEDLRIADLERELRFRDARINELKAEVDRGRELVRELEEHLDQCDEFLEDFIQTFGLVLNDDGEWTNSEAIREHNAVIGKYNDLAGRFNRLIRRFNRVTGHLRPKGRPIAASPAQQTLVLKHRKAGKSLRWIAEELTLSLRTVTTVIDKANGTDRGSNKQRVKLGLEPNIKDWRIASRQRLPKAATAYFEKSRELRQDAKGLW